jgi:hypothetical protein
VIFLEYPARYFCYEAARLRLRRRISTNPPEDGGAAHFAGVPETLSTAYVRGMDLYYMFTCGGLTHDVA